MCTLSVPGPAVSRSDPRLLVQEASSQLLPHGGDVTWKSGEGVLRGDLLSGGGCRDLPEQREDGKNNHWRSQTGSIIIHIYTSPTGFHYKQFEALRKELDCEPTVLHTDELVYIFQCHKQWIYSFLLTKFGPVSFLMSRRVFSQSCVQGHYWACSVGPKTWKHVEHLDYFYVQSPEACATESEKHLM